MNCYLTLIEISHNWLYTMRLNDRIGNTCGGIEMRHSWIRNRFIICRKREDAPTV